MELTDLNLLVGRSQSAAANLARPVAVRDVNLRWLSLFIPTDQYPINRSAYCCAATVRGASLGACFLILAALLTTCLYMKSSFLLIQKPASFDISDRSCLQAQSSTGYLVASTIFSLTSSACK